MLLENTIDNVNYMKKLFADWWKEKGYNPKYVVYQNVLSTTPTENVPFAVFDIVHTGADRCALTGISHARFRQSGFVTVQLLVPTNTGLKELYNLTQEILNLYRKPPADCPINFGGFSFRESDIRYKDFFKCTITIGFNYDFLL